MSALHWSAAYVGLPWLDKGDTPAGVSCWGLVCLVYAECAGIRLPSYAEEFTSSAERAEIAAIIEGATATWPWRRVEAGSEREFDVAVFARGGVDCHVGVVTGGGRMLHICSGHDSHLIDYREGRWAPRLAGLYRHAEIEGVHL